MAPLHQSMMQVAKIYLLGGHFLFLKNKTKRQHGTDISERDGRPLLARSIC